MGKREREDEDKEANGGRGVKPKGDLIRLRQRRAEQYNRIKETTMGTIRKFKRAQRSEFYKYKTTCIYIIAQKNAHLARCAFFVYIIYCVA